MAIKGIHHILASILMGAVCFSCTQKENDIPVPVVAFTDTVVSDFEQADLTCEVSGNFSVEQLSIEYSKDASLADAKIAKMSTSGKGFSVRIPQLEIQTTYYYRYIADNRVSRVKDDKIRQFKTKDYIAPIVTTGSATDITATSAALEGTVGYTCGKAITERGFLISKGQGSPERKVVTDDQFTLTIDNLDFGTKYNYQAYATSEIGTGTGELKEFVTLSGNPEMETKPATSIAAYTVTLNGEITSDGGSPIKERGFCYATTEAPTVEDNKVQVEGTIGDLTCEASDLIPATKYYACVYAINGKGTHYGNVVEFTTEAVPVSSITLSKTTLTLDKGKSEHLIATILPEDATDKTVTWSSSNPSIASVDQNGKVTALLGGNATISAKAGDKTATCAVTVIAYVESVSLNRTTLTIAKGSSETLIATVKPDDATDKTVTWTSSNANIASVDQTGKVTALKGGNATITAKAGEKTATCEINVTAAVTSVTLNKTTLTLDKGKSETLTATVLPEDATDKTVTWSSSNPSIASVDQDGKVTALLGGNATISAKAGDKTATCAVTVIAYVESVSLNRTTLTIAKGSSETLIATVKPDDATDKTVTWTSSNANIASVDQTGKVTALKGGNATITAKAGEKTATCEINVTAAVTSVTLNKTTLTLDKGKSETLTATVLPEDATDKTTAWSSSNPSIANVDQTGKVTAKLGGNATITAKAGDKTATCAVTVIAYVESITLNKAALTLAKGASETLVATVKPDDATDKTVTWTSSNSSVVGVNQSGMVSALKGGEATITATVGGLSATCKVTVTAAVTSVSLNKTTLTLDKGKSETLIATVGPEDATDKTVTWSSSNPSIASVDQNGKVTAKLGGNATITAKSGESSATCSVTVIAYVESVTLNKTSLTLPKGTSETLKATVKPDDATDKTVTWTSSNATVAYVDQTGKVTTLKGGDATITAKAGDKTAICEVNVTASVTSITLNKTTLTLEKGTYEVLTATVLPEDATDKTVTWSSSDALIASVDQNGKVTALKGGNVTISAKAGEMTATCTVTVVVSVTSVALSQTSLSLEKGQSTTLTATIVPSDATDKTIVWASSNSTVASADQTGKVTALKGGKATITATASGKTASCEVTVTSAVSSVTLNKTELTLEKGSYEVLTATVLPEDATDKTVTWSSSNTSIASVDQTGKVTAIRGGNAIISAKAGEKTATCSVMVVVSVTSVTLSQTSLSLEKGQSTTLTATVNPSDATDKTIIWASSNASIANVDQNGKVTALLGGNATITAKAGDKTATCAVNVLSYVESVTLNKSSITIAKGSSETLVATVKPDDTTDKTVTWTSSNTLVASVDQNGKVTALKGGKVTITAKAGEITASCEVIVTAAVTSITLNKTSLTLDKGESETLVVTVGPEDATDKTVTWSSSNPSIASVDQNGKVAAKLGGTVTITAKAGGLTTSCSVTVISYVESITLNKTALTLAKGSSETLIATVKPDDATDKTVTWTSSNSFVVSVNQSGVLTALKGGEATITASVGGMSATCKVTVTAAVTTVSLNKTTITLDKGKSEMLIATVGPEDATDRTVTWTSSNASVASVDQNGTVTALKGGNATINAKAGEITATCDVTVVVPVTSVSLSQTTLSLEKGQSATLTVVVSPTDATDYTIVWASSNSTVASVDQTGLVLALKAGTATITATADGHTATCIVDVPSTPEIVDLGLSVDWASWNVGATAPEEYGNYFAWGETQKKVKYTWNNYKWCDGSSSSLTKYNTNSTYGTVDNKTTLELGDDAARANYGGYWRMPTEDEWAELKSECTWKWTTINGVYGRKVTSGKTGYTDKWIFLPAAGYRDNSSYFNLGVAGAYWSSSLYTDGPDAAWSAYFDSGDNERNGRFRARGLSVRPVYGGSHVTGVDLDKTSLSMRVGDTQALTAIVTPSGAINQSVSWFSSNTSVATVSSSGFVMAKAAGSATITVTTNDRGYKAKCVVFVSSSSSSEAVDLGLSVKWASWNVGATAPEEYGDYFAWGETQTKANYTENNYKWCDGSSSSLTKYNTNSTYGTVDNKTTLDLQDDAARANWGGSWRMPTDAEWTELRSNCNWEWTTINGVFGRKVTSTKTGYTDKWIFLPAAGIRQETILKKAGSYGYYWSSSLAAVLQAAAYDMYFGSDQVGRDGTNRYFGLSVRPVTK